jgi:hypothetical protein
MLSSYVRSSLIMVPSQASNENSRRNVGGWFENETFDKNDENETFDKNYENETFEYLW